MDDVDAADEKKVALEPVTESVPVLVPPAEELQPFEVVHFGPGDTANPYNWGWPKKLFVVLTAVLLVVNSTMSSAVTSNATAPMLVDFGRGTTTSSSLTYLPTTLYLIGYVFGPLVFSPLSETIGRRPVVLGTFSVFVLFTLASAVAPGWGAFLFFRLVCGTCGSVPLTVIGGLYADVFASAATRGRAMVAFMTGTMFGPILGPIVSGYVTPARGWRWAEWTALLVAGASWAPAALLPETYGPVLLRRRAEALRKTGHPNAVAPVELSQKRDGTSGTRAFVTNTLLRPLRMLVTEPLVGLTCLFIALIYAICYLFFEAYPILFCGIYGFTSGEASLALIPIAVGSLFSAPVLVGYDVVFERAKARGAAWAQREELHRLPLACVGGPFVAVSLFWLAFTAAPAVHWAVPCLSGLAFGFGYILVFSAMLNNVVDAYDVYAASGMAASCVSRSVVGATLPLATQPMYDALGRRWATALTAFLSLAMVPIPFALVRYGPQIRARSKLCQALAARKREAEETEEAEVSA